MTLLASKLADELKALGLYSTEPAAINAWANAFNNYFTDAMSNAVPIAPGALPAAKAAMISAMVGLSTSAGPVSLQASIVAYWGSLIPATAWPTVTVITPPVLLAGLTATLVSVFAANITSKASKNDSMTAIANAIHAANVGGIAVWPVPIGPQPIV